HFFSSRREGPCDIVNPAERHRQGVRSDRDVRVRWPLGFSTAGDAWSIVPGGPLSRTNPLEREVAISRIERRDKSAWRVSGQLDAVRQNQGAIHGRTSSTSGLPNPDGGQLQVPAFGRHGANGSGKEGQCGSPWWKGASEGKSARR